MSFGFLGLGGLCLRCRQLLLLRRDLGLGRRPVVEVGVQRGQRHALEDDVDNREAPDRNGLVLVRLGGVVLRNAGVVRPHVVEAEQQRRNGGAAHGALDKRVQFTRHQVRVLVHALGENKEEEERQHRDHTEELCRIHFLSEVTCTGRRSLADKLVLDNNEDEGADEDADPGEEVDEVISGVPATHGLPSTLAYARLRAGNGGDRVDAAGATVIAHDFLCLKIGLAPS